MDYLCLTPKGSESVPPRMKCPRTGNRDGVRWHYAFGSPTSLIFKHNGLFKPLVSFSGLKDAVHLGWSGCCREKDNSSADLFSNPEQVEGENVPDILYF